MTSIGIVGAGIAGAHLGLLLQREGVETVIYTERSAEEQRRGHMASVPTHFSPTRRQERLLGLPDWDDVAVPTRALHCQVRMGTAVLGFSGTLSEPALCIDHRVYVPALLEQLEARGGRVEVRSVSPADLAALAAMHDLVVVCTGRAGLGDMFPRIAARSPYERPQRWITSGVFHGIRHREPPGLSLSICEHGEIFATPFHTVLGQLSVLSFEGIPGGAFEALSRMRRGEDPRGFERAVLAAVRANAPELGALIDEKEFALTRPEDLLRGGLTPVVRRGHVRIDERVCALAIGDAHVVNDPITGQGANLAARAARILGQAIVAAAGAGAALDETFCRAVEEAIWAEAGPATMWTNLMLGPPAPQVVELLGAAAGDPRVADAFVTNFEDPRRQWRALASPAATERFLAGFRAAPGRELGAAASAGG